MANQEQAMYQEIESLDANRILNSGVDALVDYFWQKYRLEVPVLREAEIQVEEKEAQVDVTNDPSRIFRYRDDGRRHYVPGMSIIYFVPFDGDADLLKCQASTSTSMPPQAEVKGNELKITFTRADHNAEQVKAEFDRELGNIHSHLGWVSSDVAPFNQDLPGKARVRIEARRDRLMKSREAVTALGYPLRRRDGAPQTYSVPEVRRKIPVIPSVAAVTGQPFEPTLDTKEYEHILGVMRNMVLVMERSPSTFQDMGEEAIRQHFLVQLNAQYEGQATGETFNAEGKTDILIRVKGRNIFIAECKFWDGPGSLNEAVDQIMDYSTWRDTKTAILLFNRDRKLTTVLTKIPEVMGARQEYVRELTRTDETTFRYTLRHKSDPQREMVLSILVFEIPGP